MNAYDVRYKKVFSGFSIITRKPEDISAEEKLAYTINSSWKYSWYWPKDIDAEWLERVSKDLETEMEYAKSRVKELEHAQEILDQINL